MNYEALWPENIPEIQLSKNFVKFQNLIRSRAQKINREQGRESYTTELKQEAGDIIDAWKDAKNDVSRGIRDAVFDNCAGLSGDAFTALSKQGRDVTSLAVGATVGVVLAAIKGVRLWRDRKRTPYQYLTEVVDAQNPTLRLTLPLGPRTLTESAPDKLESRFPHLQGDY